MSYSGGYTFSRGGVGMPGGDMGRQSPLRSDHIVSDRRVIFPSLHSRHSLSPSALQRSSGQSASQEQPRLSRDVGRRERSNSIDLGKSMEFSPSPTDVAASIEDATRPTLHRANSLDGIPIPLPKLSLTTEERPANKVLPPRSNFQGPFGRIQDIPAHQVKLAAQIARARPMPPPPLPVETKSSKPQFIGDRRHRTYYPAASLPTPVNSEKKSPSPAKPASSILRRKGSLESTFGMTSSFNLDEASTKPSACLSSSVPPLASPASIRSLHPARSDSDEQDSIGESLDDLQRLSGRPKVLPRSSRCKLRRPQSDTIVTKNDEDQSLRKDSTASISNESSVSRHESLECIGNNKRTSFDPHVTVYEFNVDSYERRGGEKWWTEEELEAFKLEAIKRIRLRSTKLIPTGTGRAMAVTKVASKDDSAGGSVMFNHPALGCDDDLDPETHSSRKPAAASEIKSILVVDPHEIFLSLFSKSLKRMIGPTVSVATARSAEEALARIEAAQKAFPLSDGGSINGFDIIVVEERLRGSFAVQQLASSSGPHASLARHSISTQTAGDDSVQRRQSMASGATLIRHLAESEERKFDREGSAICNRCSLLIGVSARLSLDREKLERSGADLVWGKPPPVMDDALRNELLKLLMKKRSRTRA